MQAHAPRQPFNSVGLFVSSPTPPGESVTVKSNALVATVGAVVIIAILALAFAIGPSLGSNGGMATTSSSNSGSGTTSTANSVQAGNQTYVATYVSTMESAPSTSSSTASSSSSSTAVTSTLSTTASSATSGSQTTGNSFSYAASSQVKVLSVQALVSGSQPGDATVTFRVTYENIGSGDIYVLEGGGSDLNVTIVSGGSILQKVTGPRCEIAVAMVPLAPGAQATAITPGCWSGFHYQLMQTGNIQVLMTLGWTSESGQGGSVEITAHFALS